MRNIDIHSCIRSLKILFSEEPHFKNKCTEDEDEDGLIFQQIADIPMGTSYTLILAD